MSAPADREAPIRVCIVCLHAYGLFDRDSGIPHGGMENRAATFARHLAARPGLAVTVLVDDFGQPYEQRFDGVRVVPYRRRIVGWLDRVTYDAARAVRWGAGFPGATVKRRTAALAWELPVGLIYRSAARLAQLRHRGPYSRDRWDVPWRVYREIGADVVITFGVSATSAKAIASARAYGQRSILMLASDDDLSLTYTTASDDENDYASPIAACRYALSAADRIVAQTATQVALLAKRFGRQADIVRNPIDLEGADAASRSSGAGRHVLWIGRADGVHKRPQLCVALAARCPDIPFVLVMNPKDAALEARVRAEATPNVRFVPSADATAMRELYASAAALVNTSSLEGFPNTFLEAGKFGVPVFSLDVDPDGLLACEGCGVYAAGDLDALAAQLRRLWSDRAWGEALSGALLARVRSHHEVRGRAEDLERLVREVRAAP